MKKVGSTFALRPSMATTTPGQALRRRLAPARGGAAYVTAQAPHSPSPQPYFVPVNRNSSRRLRNNGILGSPSN